MESTVASQLAAEWMALVESQPERVRQAAHAVARVNGVELATHFYAVMLGDKLASQFLTHEQVKTALHASMKEWVADIVDVQPSSDFESMVNRQIFVGNVHARVGVPVHIVLQGARALKSRFKTLIDHDKQIDGSDKLPVYGFLCQSIDLAMEIMAGAYASSYDRSTRAEESYRLFSMVQDVTAEKQHKRSVLLNWENEVMYGHALIKEPVRLPRIGDSDFGLWFKHKGAHVFQGSYETQIIIAAMEYIDNEILPVLGRQVDTDPPPDLLQSVRDLHEQVRLIQSHLDRLFEERSELEAGRDSLTRLLSRRFLDVILAKEVSYARNSGTRFALVALDVDFFKDVNDTWGHDSGDMVLKQLAQLLNEHVRGGDYVFRMGGEEFLILLVDVKPQGVKRIAEKLRARVSQTEFRLRNDNIINITVSVGVALHDGHPDHARVLRAADDALYQAKNSGRNSVIMAQPA